MHGAAAYESQMVMHTSTANIDIIYQSYYKNIFHTQHGPMAYWITVMTEKVPVNGSGLSVSIMHKTEKMCHKYQLKCHVQQLISQHC